MSVGSPVAGLGGTWRPVAFFSRPEPIRSLFRLVYAGYRTFYVRDRRDRRVSHSAQIVSSEGIEAYLYQLKRYVEKVLVFHLRSSHEFLSVEEASRFLDQPTDPAAIERKISDLRQNVDKQEAEIELAEKARRFHGGP
jgi:hypothetical protein